MSAIFWNAGSIIHPIDNHSTNPYFTLIRSSFSNIGSAANQRKIHVEAAWMQSTGNPEMKYGNRVSQLRVFAHINADAGFIIPP